MMKQFEIDSMKNSIHFGKTKAYFEEVLISYQENQWGQSHRKRMPTYGRKRA